MGSTGTDEDTPIMTPADEATFIQLWQAGATHTAIAQALGCPLGTVKSRSHRLQQQGKIQARPPAQPAAQTPGQPTATGAVHRADTDAEQIIDTGAVSSVDIGAVQTLDTGAVQRLDQLEVEVQGLTTLVKSLVDRLEHPPGPTPVQISTLPPYPKGKAVRWNLWLLDAIREELATVAAARDVSPSQRVQEVLWQWLSDRRAAREPAP
jgi:hypothetical protein